MKKGMKKVYVYRVSYFMRTKRIYDIIIVPKKEQYTARHYYDCIKAAGVPIPPEQQICGTGFAVVNGHDKEQDISSYRDI